MFEYIYFARPDSKMAGTVLQVARARMGEILWREAPVEADLVIPVPDSGNAAARGLARAAGLPQDDGFIKNRYVARTFIQPGQELRRHGLRLKFNPLPEVVAGKRLVVVDDSIVRGNTTPQIVQMLRDAGAAEIHLRISSPPIKHPCHYGIDMSTREEMIAHGRTVEEIADELGADSLHYLSLEGVYEAVGVDRATPLRRVLHRRVPARRAPRTRAASTRSSPSCRWFGGLKVAVLASGAGTNLQALLDRVHGRDGDRDRRGRVRQARGAGARAGAGGGRAGRGVPACDVRETARERDLAIADWLSERGVELVVLAGYMQLLSAAFLERFPERGDQRPPGAAARPFPGCAPSSRRWRTGSRCSASPSTSSTRASTAAR